jgi:predicted RNA-binding Zn-ribbon protein involved in translation (DUF1610 family)
MPDSNVGGITHSNGAILTSQIKRKSDENYHCPECGSKYPGKFALGEHRLKFHDIPNDWKKRIVRNMPHRAAKPSRAGRKVIATTEVVNRNGFKCPECGIKFPLRRTLGVHRKMAHGIAGNSYSALHKTRKAKIAKGGRRLSHEAIERIKDAQRARWARYRAANPTQNGAYRNGKSNPSQETTAQLVLANGSARKRGAWSEESIAGFIFAHIHTLIENACQGRADIIPNVTQRLSELLSFEVSGAASRARNLGLLRSLS